MGGNLLGYVSEVNPDYLKRNPEYKTGDYVGMNGVESAYEPQLRGRKGVRIQEIDTHGAIKGSYMNGRYDSVPEPGRYLVSTIDARLQLLGEELMRGKVGAAVAIEPSTGEILMMVSSPTYDPDQLVGRQRGNNYMKMLGNKRQPLYNRAVRAKYPPGSTFKLVQGLIGLQEGVLRPSDLHVCHEGYQAGRRRMKCHSHASPLDLRFAVATSCNAYFCYVFRDILDNPKYGNVKEGYDAWKEYVESFGFGRKLGSDFLDEGNGYVPDRAYYDKRYRKSWNALTVLSLSIGQDALGCTPLQLANLAAIIANLHDIFIVLGIFSVMQWEFSLPVLAAVLAVLGYSVNESVIIFDRVREHFRTMRRADTMEVINSAITATISRTVITHTSTLCMTLSMFFFGGPALHYFSLALTIGILLGVYSSVFVAAAIALYLGVKREDLVRPVKKDEVEEMVP